MEDRATYRKEKPISGKYGESIDILKQDDGIVISVMDYSGMTTIALDKEGAEELVRQIRVSLRKHKAKRNE